MIKRPRKNNTGWRQPCEHSVLMTRCDMKSGFCTSGVWVDCTDFIFMFLDLDWVCTLWVDNCTLHSFKLSRVTVYPWYGNRDTYWMFLICNYTSWVNWAHQGCPASSEYAPSGAPQPWRSVTLYHLVSERGSRSRMSDLPSREARGHGPRAKGVT